MTVTVKMFGMLKTHLAPELQVTLDGGCRVNDLIAAIQAMNPDVGELLLNKNVLVSVNHDVAYGDQELSISDEIALLPPFSGG